MEKIDLVLWFMGAGFSVMFTLMLIVWNNICGKFDKIDSRFEKIESKFDKIDNDIKELRTSINRMEGAFYNKDCCMLKNDQQLDKAE